MTVINGTGKPLSLKEGTAGIFIFLKKLQPNDSYQIVVDTNATYREYWCAVQADDPDGGVVVSSDDCEDLKQVTIIETRTGTNTSYSYVGVNRESGNTTTVGAKILEKHQTVNGKQLRAEWKQPSMEGRLHGSVVSSENQRKVRLQGHRFEIEAIRHPKATA